MNELIFNSTNPPRQYLICVATILSVSGCCFAMADYIGYRVVAFVLLLAVSLLAVLFDILPVLVSAVLSAFVWDFFFIPPRFAFHVETPEDNFLLLMYFVIALINGVLTYRIRKVEKAFRLKEERANSVHLYNTVLNSLSHELRTPIAAIIGAADNLQLNKALSKSDADLLINEISKASFRLNQQVENLLNISRLESGHIKPRQDWCDIPEVVYDVVKRVEENNPTRRININISQSMPVCRLDKGMLDQILYNLVNNAATHTNPEADINVTASCHTNLLELVVEDNGTGFTEKKLTDMFLKFSREKHMETSGSGLGLSIVKGFTEALGGTVSLEKGKFGGARFVISIPVKTTTISTVNE
jgi:two-component system, OmpR family, sensor histidine kinase KdpD